MLKKIQKLVSKLRSDKRNKRLYQSGWNTQPNMPTAVNGSTAYWESSPNATMQAIPVTEQKAKEFDARLEKKPVEVFQEIICEVPKMNMIDLDKQIAMVERRKEVLESHLGQNNFPDETQALVFLKARKKFAKYSNLFQWQVTTKDKIAELCKKYKVKEVAFGLYYKNIPMEAIDEIEKFSNAHAKVADYMPVFSLIVDDGGKETKKDPILLAQSPFGKWYYVLGAWDKEVIYIDEIIYNGR